MNYLYLKFTLNTDVLVLVYSLHIKNSPTSYSSFLYSNFLISFDTFLQVVFKHAMLLLELLMSVVYPKYFSITFTIGSLFTKISNLIFLSLSLSFRVLSLLHSFNKILYSRMLSIILSVYNS